jgi:hypothetical protein
MSVLSPALVTIGRAIAAEDVPFDDQGYHTIDPIFAPAGELIIGSTASIIIFGLLYKFAGPTVKEFFRNRTSRIQTRRATSTPNAAACMPRPTSRPRRCSARVAPVSRSR